MKSRYSLCNLLFFSLYTNCGGGFEAFLTSDGILHVGVYIKKSFYCVQLPDHNLADLHWHSISVTHSAARHPFAQNQLVIYIDGTQRLSADLKFPSVSEVNTT